MNTKELIKHHESAVQILEAIQSEEQVLEGAKAGLNGYGATHFIDTRRAYQKSVTESQIRLERLKRQYYQLSKSKIHEND